MREVCIPLPSFGTSDKAEVEVLIASSDRQYRYRIEAFPWKADKENCITEDERFDSKISGLMNSINGYDKSWELLQIFSPERESEFVHVLFRMKAS